jgi:hypothetical protein
MSETERQETHVVEETTTDLPPSEPQPEEGSEDDGDEGEESSSE